MKINKRPYEIKSLGLDKKLKEIFRNIDNGWYTADLIRHYSQFLAYSKIQDIVKSDIYKFQEENIGYYYKEDYNKAELKYLALKLQDFL